MPEYSAKLNLEKPLGTENVNRGFFTRLIDDIDSKAGAPNGLARLDQNGNVLKADGSLAGEVTAAQFTEHKEERATVQKAGHVQLSDAISSTDTTKAATSNAVKKAYDRANEAFLSASNGKNMLTNAITGTDPRVVIPSDPSFGQLATAVRQIQTGKKFASGNYTVADERKSFPSYITGNRDDIIYVNYQNYIQINGLAFEPSLIFVKGVTANASTLYKKGGIVTKGGRLIVASSLNDFGYPFVENSALSVTGHSFCLPITVDGNVAVTWIAYE